MSTSNPYPVKTRIPGFIGILLVVLSVGLGLCTFVAYSENHEIQQLQQVLNVNKSLFHEGINNLSMRSKDSLERKQTTIDNLNKKLGEQETRHTEEIASLTAQMAKLQNKVIASDKANKVLEGIIVNRDNQIKKLEQNQHKKPNVRPWIPNYYRR